MCFTGASERAKERDRETKTGRDRKRKRQAGTKETETVNGFKIRGGRIREEWRQKKEYDHNMFLHEI